MYSYIPSINYGGGHGVLCCVIMKHWNQSQFQLILLTTDHPCMSLCSCHCSQGHLDVIKFLLTNSKPDVNAKDSYYGRTPLHWACL